MGSVFVHEHAKEVLRPTSWNNIEKNKFIRHNLILIMKLHQNLN